MKAITILAMLGFCSAAARGEIHTITFNAAISNSSAPLSISAQQTFELKSWQTAGAVCGGGGVLQEPCFIWDIAGLRVTNSVGLTTSSLIIAGPATVTIAAPNCPGAKAFASFDIQPSAFPPDKAVTLGAYSGNVRVTMEESTDLVSWSAAQNGATHTNSPDARFFRIRIDKNAPPPP